MTPTTKPTTRPTDTKPTTTSTSGPTNAVAALKLEARYKGETVKLQWSAYTGKDFAAYLVLRADGPAEPRYPVDDATTVVARITDPWASFVHGDHRRPCRADLPGGGRRQRAPPHRLQPGRHARSRWPEPSSAGGGGGLAARRRPGSRGRRR